MGEGVSELKDRELLLRLQDVSRTFRMGEVDVQALRTPSLDIYRGEMLVVAGTSGSGKTTMLNLIGGLDSPTSGRVLFKDRGPRHGSSRAIAASRSVSCFSSTTSFRI